MTGTDRVSLALSMVRTDYGGAAQTISWVAAYIAAWVRLAAPVFIRMLRMWLAAVLALMCSRAPIS